MRKQDLGPSSHVPEGQGSGDPTEMNAQLLRQWSDSQMGSDTTAGGCERRKECGIGETLGR